jgi:hypothetical protein
MQWVVEELRTAKVGEIDSRGMSCRVTYWELALPSLFNDTHRQPVPYAYGLVSSFVRGFFQGTPRLFKHAPAKYLLAGLFQTHQLPFLLLRVQAEAFLKSVFKKYPPPGFLRGRQGFSTRRRSP